MKNILIALLLLVSASAMAWTQTPAKELTACRAEAPYGFPFGKEGIPLCRTAYATMVDPVAKLALWNVYTVTPYEALGCVPRSNAFVSDKSVPVGQRAELIDYVKSGYDRGHLAPNGDMSFDTQVEYESFLLSNIVPQVSTLNRGGWKWLETYIRAFTVQQNTTITVYSGPIYSETNPTIGPNKVVVPHAFYKIMIDNNTKDVLAFIFPQSYNAGADISSVQSTVTDIARQTKLNFPLPQGAILNKYPKDFPIDFGDLTLAGQMACP